MPFYIRKRIKIAPGLAINLSKSGLGLSAGVKGFRISKGPRGTQINAGRGGLYYRKSLNGPRRRSTRHTDAPIPAPQIISNITMAAPSPTVVVVAPQSGGPGLLVRGLYFVFIGCWLGAICTTLAWLLQVTIIGLPLGLMIINRLPQLMTLKAADARLQVTVTNGVVGVAQGRTAQYRFLVRALFYVLVGWWFSALWLLTAWSIISVTMGLALPIAFWMFNRAPAVTTLAR